MFQLSPIIEILFNITEVMQSKYIYNRYLPAIQI